jgi:ATP-dependent Clp protease adaptor protein ClpS
MAASTALPPRWRICTAAWAARGWLDATTPCCEAVIDRPGTGSEAARAIASVIMADFYHCGTVGAMPKGKPREQGDTAVVTEKKSKTQKPKLWKVILHNDDFTTMEFVIHVLEVVFSKKPAEAAELMLQVHHRGMCVGGVYTYEIAETKVNTVEQMALAAEFPFLCTMEPE